MSPWDILVRIACLPEIAAARYGFVTGRSGGTQLLNPSGFSWPQSKFINCCTWVAEGVHLAQYLLGHQKWLSADDWRTAMCYSIGDPGSPKMVCDLGLAKELHTTLPEDLAEGDWYVCQGWNGNFGHSFLLRVVPMGGGEAEVGVMWLEAVGRARGGAWKGIDGVGSRTCVVPSARNWGGGWPQGTEAPMSRADVLSTYSTLFTAKLEV